MARIKGKGIPNDSKGNSNSSHHPLDECDQLNALYEWVNLKTNATNYITFRVPHEDEILPTIFGQTMNDINRCVKLLLRGRCHVCI